MDGYIRLSSLAVVHSVVIMTIGSQSRQSQIESYGQPIFDPGFIKFVFRISGGIIDWIFIRFVSMRHCCFRFSSHGSYKNLDFPLSIITFTFNKHADNHFNKYIYLFQILRKIKSIYLSKYMLKAHRQIAKKRCFGIDQVCQFSALQGTL